MKLFHKAKIYIFPIIFLILPGCLGIAWDLYHRYFKGQATPFWIPSLGLLLLSLFFWARRKWVYFLLMGVTGAYLFFFFQYFFNPSNRPQSIVYYYRHWTMDTQTGLIRLKQPMGMHPPAKGAYISCNFSLKNWIDYFKTQPILCTAFDSHQRLKMFLNDSEGPEGPVREFQINYFSVDRKSLLGEPLDRWALRVAFSPVQKGVFPGFGVKAIYEVYERQIEPGKNKIVESFSRHADGQLKSFTESPYLKFSNQDIYALYGPDGSLLEIPRYRNRNFSFPAKIDIQRHSEFSLPKFISSIN